MIVTDVGWNAMDAQRRRVSDRRRFANCERLTARRRTALCDGKAVWSGTRAGVKLAEVWCPTGSANR